MENKIREISNKRKWKRIIKRSVALLCAAVMLFTMNTLKRNANTLEHIPMCGYAEHVHSASCFSGDVLVCEMTEHVHTDACYQEQPISTGMDDLDIDMEGSIVGDTVEDLDLSLALDDSDLVMEDVLTEPVSNAVEAEEFYLGTGAMVSQIIETVGLSVSVSDIVEVAAVENDEAHSGLIAVEKVDGDYRVWAKRDFVEAELALIITDDIYVVKLRDGIAQPEDATPEEQSAIEDVPDPQAEDADPAELPAFEDEAPVDGQAEETVFVDGVSPDVDDKAPVDEQTETVEPPAAEGEPEGQAEDAAPAEQPATEAEAPAEDAEAGDAGSVEQPAAEGEPEGQAEDAAPAEQPATEAEAPAEDAGAGDAGSVEQPATEGESEGQAEDAAPAEQPATEAEAPAEDAGAGDAGSVEQPAAEGESEGQAGDAAPAEQPAIEAEAPAEDAGAGDAGSVEQPAAEGESEGQAGDAAPAEQPAIEVEAPVEDAETGDAGSVEPPAIEGESEKQAGDAAPVEQPAIEVEAPVEDAETGDAGSVEPPVIEGQSDEQVEVSVPMEEESDETADLEDVVPVGDDTVITEDEGTGEPASIEEEEQADEHPAEEQGEEQPAEGASEEQGEEQPAEGASEEQGEEQPAEGASEEQGEEQPAGGASEEQGEEQPAGEASEEQGEEQPAGEVSEEQGEEQPAGDASEEQGEEQPAEEVTEEQGEEQPDEEEEIEGQAEEQIAGESESPVYTATIDLTEVETYPLSLNAMLTAAKPEDAEAGEAAVEGEADEETTAEETTAAESTAEANPTTTIEYDVELLEAVEQDGDWLITPIQAFESTQIIVTNGSVYALTLVNCVLPETAEAQPEAAYPAQDFEDRTDYVKVSVTAPEGAFPEGTTMTVTDVEDEKTLNDIQDTVTEGFVEVERVHAVDIVFRDAEGNEIEPLVPISVVMTVAEIAQEEAAVLVHVDDTGATEVVESQTGAPAGETEIAAEMPAVEEQRPGSGEEETQPDGEAADEETQADGEAADEETAVGFESDSFSVYAVVVTRTIETKYIDAEGETWNISVGYGPEADIPAGATLKVEEVEEAQYLSEAKAAVEGGKRVTLARFFDISILDAEGATVQPKVPVTVNITLDNSETQASEVAEHVIDKGEPVAVALHFEEKDDALSVDVKEAEQTGETVVFDAESFSVWGVVFTVDFYYGDYEYHLPGEGYITLPGLFDVLKIEADAAQAKDVVFTNPELVAVRRVEEDTPVSAILAEYGDVSVNADPEGEEQPEAGGEGEIIPAGTWLLVSLAPFDTEEKLTVTMANGAVYEIRVEDDATDYTVLVNDTNGGYINPTGSVNAFIEYSSGGYQFVQNVLKDSQGNVQYFQHVSGKKAGSLLAVAKSGYDFVFWLVVQSDGTMLTIKGETLATEKMTYTNALYIPCFAPTGAKLIIRGEPQPSSAWHYTPRDVVRYVFYTSRNDDVPRYNYSTDNGGNIEWQTSFDEVWNREMYNFLGWYNLNRHISDGRDINDNGVIKHNFKLSDVTEHTVLIPKYELKPEYRNYLNVWFDGTNGVYGGEAPNNTFYSRIESTGNVRGSTSVLQQVYKSNGNSGSATVTLPTTAVDPQSQGDNHFELQGWYDINNKRWYAKGATVTITTDSVFYADWMPTNYNASSASSVSSLNTNSFITTRMFDYNNLFNMDCIELDSDQTYVNMFINSERWKMKGTSDDFVFITKQAGLGKSVMPDGRTSNNTNNETTTNGTYYSGQVSPGLLSDGLRSRLFGTSDGVGKRYLGTANYLYQYDNNTGYYYYDSDKNAASYDKGGQRFYVYSYTNATDKSNGLDGDFLPYNYGNSTFTEAYGAPNYWFGMSSQIDFFLPNAAGYTDNQGVTGNRSIKGDEMVYKFAGDDDVWVFVDGQLVLDMGGVHGKVYGEINFSQGTWTVVSDGASKVNDAKGIMSYAEGTGAKETGTLNLAEGDHTLTLYYLERGSSQSNCAIYFNLAPRYALQFHKVDASSNANLGGATFGVYTDPECTVAANVWGTYTGARTNIFTTGDSGYVHCSGLVAGKTYYIKELSAPAGYPDVSEEVIALQLDARGVPTVSSSVDSSAWTMAGVRSSEAEDSTEKGTFMLYMTVKNRKQTDISAQKIWAMVDGSQYSRDENCSVTVKLQRYSLTAGEGEEKKYSVRLIQRYFADGDRPTNRDTAGKLVYDINTQEVSKGGSITFTASAGNGAGIASVTSQHGIVAAGNTTGTGSQHFYMNGGWSEATQSGTYTLSNVQSDTDVYITYIGATDLPEYLGMAISNISMTGGDGTRYVRTEDADFNRQSEVNGQQTQVTLNKGNNWKVTWTNLETAANNIQYYYYVKEISNSSQLSENPLLSQIPAYVTTYSSDGLSGGGTISVRNTLQAVKVKLRKRDASTNENLAGVEFKLYTRSEYENQGYRETERSVIEDNASVWLEGDSTYDSTKEAFVSDEMGRFYTGYLPLGVYYIVETGGYEGYEPLTNPVMVQVTEHGLAYKLDPAAQSWSTKHIDGNGYYNLYINNNRRYDTAMVPASVTVNKQDEAGTTLDGATFTLYDTNDNGNLSGVVRTYTGGSFAISTDDVISGEGDSATHLRDLLGDADSLTLYLKETEAPEGYAASDEIFTIVITRTVTGPVRDIQANAFLTTTTYGMTIDEDTSKDVPNTPVPGDLELTKKLTGDGADASKQFDFEVALTFPTAATAATTYLTTVNGTAAEPVTVAEGETAATVTVTLAKDQTWKIDDLPAGTTYVITESEYGAEGYTSSIPADGLTGTIRGKATEKEAVEVTNTYSAGGLTVEKTVSGNAVEATRDFSFKVTFRGTGLSGAHGSYKKGTEATLASAAADSITFTEGVSEITFDLRGGEKAAFENLPAGTTFVVQEISADADGYETTVASEGGTVNADKTVTGAIGSDTVITASYVNAKETIVVTATKAWKSGTQTVAWPEDVRSVEFTLYKTVNETTTEVSATDVPGIANPATVDSATTDLRASWINLPTRYLVNGTWYDANYSVEETKVTYTDGTELTDPAVIAAAFSPKAENGIHTNNIPRVDVDVTKRWTKPGTPPTGTEVTVTLSATAGAAYVLPEGIKAEIKLNGDTSKADDTETAWYYHWTDLPKYDGAGHPVTYTVAETAVTYEGVTYSAESGIRLSDMFQVTTTQPVDGQATIDNDLYETTLNVFKRNAETKAALSGAVFTLEKKNSNDVYEVYGTSQTSGDDGKLAFQNLPGGEYRLAETGIPGGYARTSSGKYIYFTIKERAVTWNDTGAEAIKKTGDGVEYSEADTQFTVDNTPGARLPSTGGYGTAPYYFGGSLLILCAFIVAVNRRRKLR